MKESFLRWLYYRLPERANTLIWRVTGRALAEVVEGGQVIGYRWAPLPSKKRFSVRMRFLPWLAESSRSGSPCGQYWEFDTPDELAEFLLCRRMGQYQIMRDGKRLGAARVLVHRAQLLKKNEEQDE